MPCGSGASQDLRCRKHRNLERPPLHDDEDKEAQVHVAIEFLNEPNHFTHKMTPAVSVAATPSTRSTLPKTRKMTAQ